MTRHRTAEIVLAVVATALALVGIRIAYDRYTDAHAEKYVVTREDDGRAITRVIAAAFDGASALKVGSLGGTIQGAASDSRAFGLLNSDRVVKVPFAVDYFVDLSHLGRRDMRWNAAARTLMVDVPDVSVAVPNIDEANATLVSTRGVFVTRGAAEALAHAISVGTTAKARAEAERPERIAQARAQARAALTRLMEAPLDAAGYDDVRVAVRFPFDPAVTDGRRWDTTRSLEQVLGNTR